MSLGVDSSDKIVACGDSIVENPACCSRSDGSSYILPCCPSATFNCESEQFDYELCGFSEYQTPSSPPKKYRRKEGAGTLHWRPKTQNGSNASTAYYRKFDYYTQYSALDCSTTSVGNGDDHISRSSVGGGWPTCDVPDFFGSSTFKVEDTISSNTLKLRQKVFGYNPVPTPSTLCSNSGTETLSDEDTDADAISRATGASGTSCSSRWETRNTQFDWIKRTSGYKIECSALVVGATYTVTPSIRKRTAQDDGSGTWEDVTVTPVDFTATSDTETIDDGGDFIELDSIQGWEYEITAVSIEKKA